MIPTENVWYGVSRLAKSGTSGYQDEDQFNLDLDSVQKTLMSMFAPMYGGDQTVKDLLSVFITPLSGSSDSAGVLAFPSNYYQLDTVIIDNKPAFPVDTNERAMQAFIPTRRPSSTEGRYYYYIQSESINLLPAASYVVSGTYLRKPDVAEIVLTPVSEADRDYVTPSSTSDLEWPERVYNIIVYMMGMKLGLDFEKQILLEFSQMGISMESSNFVSLNQ